MNLPNRITLTRIFMVPVFAVLALVNFPGHQLWAALVFGLAAMTDFLDGHLARQRHQVSNFGKFMDPLADKMLVMTALIILVSLGDLPAWVVIIIVCRDLAVDGLRLMASEQGTVIAASKVAKLKTLTQMVMVIFLLLGGMINLGFYHVLCQILVYAAVMLTVYSGVEYLINGRRFIR